MSRLWIVAAWALCACGADPGTAVDVLLDADAVMRAEGRVIGVHVEDGLGTVVADERLDLGDHPWPVTVRLRPRGGDSTRRFLLAATLLDAAETPIGRVSARGGYDRGARRIVRLRFDEACRPVACPANETCAAGVCGDACVIEPCAVDPPDAGTPADGEPPDAAPLPDPAFLIRTVDLEVSDATTPAMVPDAALTLPAGADHVVMISAVLETEAAAVARAFELRYRVDGVTRGLGTSHNGVEREGGAFQHFTLVRGDAEHVVTVEVTNYAAATAGTPSATARDLRVVAFPVPAGADVQTDERDPNRLVLMSEGWASTARLSFTPSAAGDYLVMAAIAADEAPGLDGIDVRLTVDGAQAGIVWTVATDDYQTLFFAPVIALDAAAHTLTLEVRAAAPSSNLAHAHLLALRTDAFARFSSTSVPEVQTTSSATPAPIAMLEVPAGDHVVIQSMALSAAGVRGAELTGLDPPVVIRHAHADATGVLSYGTFSAARLPAARVHENRAFGGSATVTAQEAVIHALGF